MLAAREMNEQITSMGWSFNYFQVQLTGLVVISNFV
jgi:hypothetical protein